MSFWNRIKANRFWSSVLVVLSGGVLAQAFLLASTPVISRLYTPSDFGLFAFVSSASILVGTVSSFGLSSAIMAPDSLEESSRVLQTALWLTALGFIFGIMLVLASYAWAPTILGLIPEGLWTAILVVSLAFVNNVRGALSTALNRRGLNKLLAANALVNAIAIFIVSVPLGIMNTGGFGLVIGTLVGSALGILQMMVRARIRLNSPNIAWIRETFDKRRDFVIFQWPANLINNLGQQLPAQVLNATFPAHALGNYSMNERIVGGPLRVVSAPISTIYFRTASESIRSGKEFSTFTYRLTVRLLLVSMAAVAAVAAFGAPLFAIALGEEWRDAGRMAGILIPSLALFFCSNSIQYSLIATGHQRYSLVLSILRVLLVLASTWLGFSLYGTVEGVVLFISVGMGIYELIQITVCFIALNGYVLRFLAWAVGFCSFTTLIWIATGSLP